MQSPGGMTLATVGAYVRVDPAREVEVRAQLDRLDAVETFDVDGEGKVGVLIEAGDLDAAHAVLVERVQKTEGVLAAFPVYSHFGDPEEEEQA